MLGGVGACLGTGLEAPVLREGFEKEGSSETERGQRGGVHQSPACHAKAEGKPIGGEWHKRWSGLPSPVFSKPKQARSSYHFAALGVGEAEGELNPQPKPQGPGTRRERISSVCSRQTSAPGRPLCAGMPGEEDSAGEAVPDLEG
jgi:hypothetical protein